MNKPLEMIIIYDYLLRQIQTVYNTNNTRVTITYNTNGGVISVYLLMVFLSSNGGDSSLLSSETILSNISCPHFIGVNIPGL